MAKYKHFFKIALTIILLYIPVLCYANSNSQAIKEIIIHGNERIPEDTIKAYLNINTFTSYSEKDLDQSLKNLFATGFFSDIKINLENQKLSIHLIENPMINQIAFEGNKIIRDEGLRKVLALSTRSIYSLFKLQNDIKSLISLYQKQGMYSVKIEPKIIKKSQNRIDLVYEIKEGNKAKIRKIIFAGNNEYDENTLKKIISSKESSFYRIFSSSDIYDPDRILYDQELLKQHYMQKGYADFKITSFTSELSAKHDAFILTFIINEGQIYKFGKISVDSTIKNLDTNYLMSMVVAKELQLFDSQNIDASIDKMTEYLGTKGYAFAEIDYEIKKDPITLTADIKFRIDEGHKIYVNKININNNIRTLDKVIRREFRIDEGDPYNSSKIYRSKQRITNLGYFSSVEFKNSKTDYPDMVDIEVYVKEQPTGDLRFGIGYNTAEGPLSSITVNENNFLGKGQNIELIYERAKRSSDISFSFTEPYFLDRNIAAGFDVFKSSNDKRKESSYTIDSRGFVFRTAYNINEYLSHGIRYSLKKERVSDVADDAEFLIKQQSGSQLISTIGQTFAYNKLDNIIIPSKGYSFEFNQDFAGLGGNAKYLKHKITASFYYPIYKEDVILSIIARAGHILSTNNKKPLKLSDQFFVGEELIRGFDVSGIGPRDKKQGNALGGRTYYSTSAEVSFPLGLPEEIGIRGAVFIDCASLFDIALSKQMKEQIPIDDVKSLRASYGFGIIWRSPIGNIRIDYGKPLKKESFDKLSQIRLSLGSLF